MAGDRTPKAYVNSKSSELHGTFSPDGRWVAYQSNASGRSEIVVRPFPSKDPAQPVSRDGGARPRWRGDGKELFFLSPEGTMMAVGFDATNGAAEGVPRALFPTHIPRGTIAARTRSPRTATGSCFRSLPIHLSAPSWIGGRCSTGERADCDFRRPRSDLGPLPSGVGASARGARRVPAGGVRRGRTDSARTSGHCRRRTATGARSPISRDDRRSLLARCRGRRIHGRSLPRSPKATRTSFFSKT